MVASTEQVGAAVHMPPLVPGGLVLCLAEIQVAPRRRIHETDPGGRLALPPLP